MMEEKVALLLNVEVDVSPSFPHTRRCLLVSTLLKILTTS